jgi:molybdate transport system regulatory protein
MNQLAGCIAEVACVGGISLVDIAVGGDQLTAMLVETPERATYLRKGSKVRVLFKETEVSLAKGLSGRLSLRNRLASVVRKIDLGQLLAEVELGYQESVLVSIITRRSVERMDLAVGDEVEALIKANEVMLGEWDDGI